MQAPGRRRNLEAMKADDYQAKIRLWAASAAPRPTPPVPVGLPFFGTRRFSSHAELNAWKRRYLLEIARQGGVKWKSSLPN